MKQRTERMAVLVRKAIGNELVRVLPKRQITIHEVRVSPDLKQAQLWISAFDDNLTNLMEDIKEVMPQLQQSLRKALHRAKFVPRLQFQIDDRNSRQKKIDEVLSALE